MRRCEVMELIREKSFERSDPNLNKNGKSD